MTDRGTVVKFPAWTRELSLLQRSDLQWGPTSLLFNEYTDPFPGSGSNQSLPPSFG
jgi:hypothetical protein